MPHMHILSFTRPSINTLWCELFLKGPWEDVNPLGLKTWKFQTRGPEPKQMRRGERKNIHDNVVFCFNCLGAGRKHKMQTNTTIIDAVLCLMGERGHTSSEAKIAEPPRLKSPTGDVTFSLVSGGEAKGSRGNVTHQQFPPARKNKPNEQTWRKSLWTVKTISPFVTGRYELLYNLSLRFLPF